MDIFSYSGHYHSDEYGRVKTSELWDRYLQMCAYQNRKPDTEHKSEFMRQLMNAFRQRGFNVKLYNYSCVSEPSGYRRVCAGIQFGKVFKK